MKTSIKVFLGILLAALFFWLAFKEVDIDEVIKASKGMSFWWLIPFVITVLFSHYSRALRWRLLINNEGQRPARLTLFAGVMSGYLANILFARLGEVIRPVYVARKIGESNGKIIGTVVLERIIDTICMLIIIAFVFVFMISDPEILQNLFGVDLTDKQVLMAFIWSLVKWLLIAVFVLAVIVFAVIALSNKFDWLGRFQAKVRGVIKTFAQGILSIKELRNWPLFILYTVFIWAAYILMVYIPFWMFDMQTVFGLGMADALVLTVVSGLGIIVPTPGGLGTYHLFITESLFLLYAVPKATGLAYATITHTTTMIIVIATTPILLALDKYKTLKNQSAGKETTSA